jgi:DMSO/TMAO reductase YedYZ molybdopterin-dependent catalytic subunit
MNRRRVLAGAAALGLPFSWAAAQTANELAVTGDVKQGVTLDVAALRAFPAGSQITMRSALDMASSGRPFTVLRGVRLTALLQLVGLAARDATDSRKTVVMAIARNGYRVVFSWPELANTPTGDQAVVAYERDDGPLAAVDGPLWLQVPGDTPTGARDVKQLQRIEVRILRD